MNVEISLDQKQLETSRIDIEIIFISTKFLIMAAHLMQHDVTYIPKFKKMSIRSSLKLGSDVKSANDVTCYWPFVNNITLS